MNADDKIEVLGKQLIDMGKQFLELAQGSHSESPDQYIPIPKLAKQLGCSQNTVRDYIRKGYFSGYQLSERCTVVRKSEFEEWVERRKISSKNEAVSSGDTPTVDFSQSAGKGRYKSPALKMRQG